MILTMREKLERSSGLTVKNTEEKSVKETLDSVIGALKND